jgi:hypothetical protein
MLKGIKKTAKILRFVITCVAFVAALIPILLQFSGVQNFVAQTVTDELSRKLHSHVSIGSIEYKLFNKIQLDDFYVEDLQKDTLLFVKQSKAGFDFWQMFHGKILFNSLEFDQLNAHLKVDKQGHTNLDFVIEAFKPKKPKPASNIEYRINRLIIRDSYFSYTKQGRKPDKGANIMNPNHMCFSELNAEVILNIFKKDSLNAEIKQLSFRDRSGFTLSDFRTAIQASTKKVKIPFVDVKLPASEIFMSDISLNYDSLADLKNFGQKVKLHVPLHKSVISPADLGAIAPELRGLKRDITIQGLFSGRFSSLKLKELKLKYGESFTFNADLELSGMPNLVDAFIYASINDLKAGKSDIQDIVSGLTNKPFVLPKVFDPLGTISYRGNISGFFSNLVAYGNLSTQVGSISTDILLKFENHLRDLTYNGTIKSNNLQLNKLLSSKALGIAKFSFNTRGTKLFNKPLKGTVTANVDEFELNKYTYRDIKLAGDYDGSGFDGSIDLKDKNINGSFVGEIDLSRKLPFYDFDLKVDNANLNALHLTNKYPGALLSFTGNTNMVGNSLDNMNGFIDFADIKFTNKDRTLNVNEIKFTSRTTDSYTNFIVNSDFLNGSLSGNFRYSTVGNTINKMIRYYLPSLAPAKNNQTNNYNKIGVDLKLQNFGDIADILELPYIIEGVSTLEGYIDEPANKISLEGLIPTVKSSTRRFDNTKLNIENIKKSLNLTLRSQMIDKNSTTHLYVLAAASNDSVQTKLGWQGAQKITNAGEIQTIAMFRNESGATAATLQILPTEVIISDSTWNMQRATIEMNADSTIEIKNFRFENKNQYIHIDGKVSKNQSDGIRIKMNDLNLDYVMQLVRLRSISIGGYVTGEANLLNLKSQPIFEADLNVRNVALNHSYIGHANLKSAWDRENKNLMLNASFSDDNNKLVALAGGVYVPAADSLDIMFDTKGLTIGFLNRYFDGVTENVQGYGYGKLRMFGKMKNIGFEGSPYIDKARVTVSMLKTTYFFNDTVHMARKSITFKNIKVYDEERNQGTLGGVIHHSGTFSNMKYRAELKAKNMLALNTQSGDNDYFFGKAYATGTVQIYGDDKECNIVIDAASQPRSKCFIQMGGASTASDNSFVNFVNPRARVSHNVETKKTEPSHFNTKVDMRIDVTPNAEMELIVDPKAGDAITGRGSGSLRVQFDTFSKFKLYGTYTIDVGSYLFTLQTVIRKKFEIDKGSTIAWTGDPFGALVNIRALYSLSAPLGDLLDDASSTTNRGSVPVNCVLKLTDELMRPTIKFDIDLPLSDEGVKQKVKSIINTEETMNRQIAYLLILNKFYIPQSTTASSNSAGLDNTLSFATSTLSAHLNNWIQKSLNINNLSIGVDWQKTDVNADEIKAQFNYQNNRVILNGEFGYRNDNVNTSTNASKLIGDFDIEYLITESGKLRGKFYSHTIDRSQLKEAKSTQGVGVIYKEDFASVRDMISYYWRIITGKNKKKDDVATKEN